MRSSRVLHNATEARADGVECRMLEQVVSLALVKRGGPPAFEFPVPTGEVVRCCVDDGHKS